MALHHTLIAGAVAAVSALAVCGAHLVWPTPTRDTADLDAASPTERDLPAFIPPQGLNGALSTPSDNGGGRTEEGARAEARDGTGFAGSALTSDSQACAYPPPQEALCPFARSPSPPS